MSAVNAAAVTPESGCHHRVCSLLVQASKEFTYKFAERVRGEKFGAFSLGHEFMEILREGIEGILPSDAHSLAADRLHVSITDLKCCKNHLISKFTSREDLVTALLASSYIPVYAGIQPVDFRGRKYIDGGFTDALPIPPGRTVTVCPFVGTQDVCPVHKGSRRAKIRLANMTLMVSLENIKRLNMAMCPPPTSCMQSLCEEGYNDAVRFLKKEKWMS